MDVARTRRRHRPVRRPRGRAGRPLESRRGGRDRREPEPARGALSRLRPTARNHWIAFKLVGTRSNRSAIGAEVVARGRRAHAAARRRRRIGVRQPERPAPALRARHARVGGSRRDPLAVGHAAGAAAPADRPLRHRHRAGALTT